MIERNHGKRRETYGCKHDAGLGRLAGRKGEDRLLPPCGGISPAGILKPGLFSQLHDVPAAAGLPVPVMRV